TAKVLGDGVTIYICPGSKDDGLSISGKGVISLSPPTSGAYRGITIFQARAATNEIKVLGSGTLNLIGTIYAAKGQLEVSGNGLVNGDGDSVHLVGSQFIGSTMEVSGNGKVRLDARPFHSLSL